MFSLRNKLLIGMVTGIFLLLAFFSLTVYSVIYSSMTKQFDSSLWSTANIIAAAAERDEGNVEFELDMSIVTEFQSPQGPAYYQIFKDDGSIVARSVSLGSEDMELFQGSIGEPIYREQMLKNGHTARSVIYKFLSRTEDGDEGIGDDQRAITIVIARNDTDIKADLKFLRWLLIIASAVTIAISLVIAAVVVNRGLKPVNALADQIAGIDEASLASRISSQNLPLELLPIAQRLNDLLARLDASFRREQRFTADVAHELRTPIAGIRSISEVTLTRDRDMQEYKEAISDSLEISKKMQAIVDNLLILARIDGKGVTLRKEEIGLKKFIEGIWQTFEPNALDKNITFENNTSEGLSLNADPDQLQIVVSNLIDNAVEYTNKSGFVRITAVQSSDMVKIVFTNSGCELNADELLQIFDSFWRSDISRTDTGLHCGLGLALVERIVKVLGGSCTARTAEGGLFVLELSLARS